MKGWKTIDDRESMRSLMHSLLDKFTVYLLINSETFALTRL